MNERLRRLLLLVSAATARPGIPLAALAETLRTPVEKLRDDIHLLAYVGAPPFHPDDYIDLALIDDCVYVTLPQSFGRPLRLTATEAASLTAAARLLGPGDPLLSRALAKVQEAIAPAHRPLFEALTARLSSLPENESEGLGQAIERAVAARRVLEIDYFAQSDWSARTRRVKPRVVGAIDGVRYLCAQNETGEERTYRLDRISRATLTDERFAPLPHYDTAAALQRLTNLEGRTDLPRARVTFSREAAASAQARHPGGTLSADGYEADVPYLTSTWLVSYALSWGGQAKVVGPEVPREAFLRALAELRALYEAPAAEH